MSPSDPTATHRIGEIAEATGLTVRTLHYYEEIGLLVPDARSDAGHRLYGPTAIERLYQISMLRRLGLPLDAIRSTLDNDGADLTDLMSDHLATVDARLATENRLRNRLLRLVDTLSGPSHHTEDTTRALLDVLEDMTMLETTINRRIAILVYDDIDAAYQYLERVFGFGPGERMLDDDGNVVHAEIEAGDGEFWLHMTAPDFDMKSPKQAGAKTGQMAIIVDDVDAHHRFAVDQGADVLYEPVDQPYGYREYSAVDPEGHLWSFMKPLA